MQLQMKKTSDYEFLPYSFKKLYIPKIHHIKNRCKAREAPAEKIPPRRPSF